MSDRTIIINLKYHADVSQVKTSLSELKNTLNEISVQPIGFDSSNLVSAKQAAIDLKTHLQAATNVNTGKLDLNRFSQSLKQSGQSLSQLRDNLLKAGMSGQQAFLQLAYNINNADNSMLNLGTKVKEFGTTLKNTVKWQISSSILHGFMGALQKAYGYAQDLNESLTDIRIVTGYSTERMADFADQANKAAKALSTTTTEYTKASLIYYQQGLSGAEVEERTNATIKMANVTGQSAQTVSDQMTAIWNNFDNGSKSLEYYADVMTALGAATASSTDEIAQGLEKFAAIADTVGLSYEYATSALATVTAETRQSAEVVGTAFKTMFARIQGLKLGETLEDGTTFNQYSEALMAVGINIKDANGELKEMDTILNEMGTKWQTLNRDEQVALAQKVAGVRQYSQLVALMDNWDKFQTNLVTAKESEGTLDRQAKIYEESWEAASKRVQASLETIYKQLINDETFIKMLDGLSKFIDGISEVIDGMGGLKGIIMIIGSIFMTTFAKQIPSAISKLTANFNVLTGKAQKTKEAMMIENNNAIQNMKIPENAEKGFQAQLSSMQKVSQMQTNLEKSRKRLNQAEIEAYELKIKQVQLSGEYAEALGKEISQAEKAEKKSVRKAATSGFRSIKASNQKEYDEVQEKRNSLIKQRDDLQQTAVKNKKGGTSKKRTREIETLNEKIDNLEKKLKEIDPSNLDFSTETQTTIKMLERYKTLIQDTEWGGQISPEIKKDLKEAEQGFIEASDAIREFNEAAVKSGKSDTVKHLDKLNERTDNLKKSMLDYVNKIKNKNMLPSGVKEELDNFEAEIKESSMSADDLVKKFQEASKKINQSLENIESDDVEKEIEDLREELIKLRGIDPKAIDDLTEEFRSGAIDAQEFKRRLQEINETEVNPPSHNVTAFSEKLVNFGNTCMQVSMAYNSLQQLGEIWSNDDLSMTEKFSQSLGSLAMLLPLVAAAFKSETIQKKASTLSSFAAATVGKLLGASKTTETGAVWANTAAWYANPVMWIALVIIGVIAAIGALVLIFKKLNEVMISGKKISTEHCDTLIEEAEKTKELANANEELSNTIEDLLDQYNKQVALGEDASETLQNMKDKMPELIDSYMELAKSVGYSTDEIEKLRALGNLGFLTGDFTDFEEQKEKIDKDLAEETRDKAEKGSSAASKKLAAAMQETQGKNEASQFYKLTVGGFESSKGEEKKAKEYLVKNLGQDYVESSSTGLVGSKVKMKADYTNPTQFVDYYERMVAARDEMLDKMTEEERKDSDILREINEVINNTSDEYEAAKEQAEEYIEVAGKALDAKFGEEMENVSSMEEYLQLRERYLQVAKDQYGLTTEQAEAYLEEASSIGVVGQQYQLATAMAEKFGGVDTDSEQFAQIADQYYTEMSKVYGELSEEELRVAIGVIADVDSIEDFADQFELAMIKANEQAFQVSADLAKQAMEDSVENEKFDFTKLLEDKNFTDYLEEIGVSQVALTSKTYEEQYKIVSEYYSKVNTLMFNSASEQQQIHYERIAELQKEKALIDKMEQEKGDEIQAKREEYNKLKIKIEDSEDENEVERLNEQLKELENNFEKEYGFKIDSNVASVQSEIDSLMNKINELQDKKIEMAMDWSGVDEVEGGMKKVAEFSKTMKKDAEKVGDSYQLTAAQAREWLEFYPELSEIATVTNDGIVEMNAAEVDAFIDGKDAELDSAIDSKIEELEAQKTTLKEELEIRKKELEAAQKIANGEIDLQDASAQYLVDLRKNLTDYFIENKMDESRASNAALEIMGLNEEEYSNLVADASKKNAENMTTAAESGANAQVKTLGDLIDKWANFGSFLIQNIGPILSTMWQRAKSGDWGGAVQVLKDAWDNTPIDAGEDENTYEGVKNDAEYKTLDDFDRNAIYEEASRRQVDSINASIKELEDGINSLSGQQDYLRALKNQDLSEYGETSLDKDKDKKEKEDKKKKLDEEIDRYHEINEELDDLNRNLDKISKATDKAFGKQKLKLMDQEIAATEDLIDATKQYAKEAEQNLNKDAARLNAFGAQYDAQGRISNYDEMYAREIALYNQAVETGDESTIEAAEKRLEDFKQVVSNYEESLNTLEEKEDELQDYLDDAAEYELAKIEYQIELDVSLNQQDLDYIEYQLSMLGDDAFNEAQQLALLEQEASSYQAQGKAYATGVQTLLKNKGLSGADINKVMGGDLSVLQGKNFTADDITLIQNSVKGMQDSNLALMELNEKIKNTLPESFEAWNEKIDENLEKFDYYDSVGNHFKNIIDIVGTKPLGISPDFLKEMNLVQVANKKNEIEALTSNLEDLEAERKKAEEELSKAKSEESKKYWEDILKKVQDREAEIQERIFTSTEEALQQIADIYTKEIQNSLDRFEKQVAGSFETLEKLQEAYDKRKTLNEQYIADYKKLYELNKLTRQLDKAIDDTDSIKNKKILQELQDEINQAQKKGNKLSEYDLQVLQKKYELKLAEVALDDAQNAKSQVRLVRNEEGDYNYIYTADESQVDNAIQNYEDKLYELQDLNEQYIEEMGAAFIQTQQEMVDALSKIQLQDFESYADYKKAVEETTAYYQERMNYYSSELQKGLDNNVSLYENEYQKCLEYNQGKQESYDTFTTTFKETTLGQIQQNYNSIAEYQADVNRAIYGDDPKNPGGLLGDLYSGYNEWKELTKTVLETAGADMSGFADGVSTDTGNARRYVTGFAKTVAKALIGDDASSVAKTLGLSADDFGELQGAVDGKINGENGLNSSIESFRDKVWGSVYNDDGIAQGSADAKEDISDMSESAKNDFDTLAEKVADWQTKWDTEIRSAIQANEDLMNSYNALIEALSQTYTDPNNVSTNTKRNITEEVHIVTYNGEQVSGSTTTTQEEEAYQTPPSSKKVENKDATKAGGTTIQVILQDVADLGHEGIGLKYNNAWHFGGEKVFSSVSGAKTYIGSTINVPQNLEKFSHSDFMHYKDRLGRVPGGGSSTHTSSSGRTHGGGGASFDTGGYTGSWGTSDGKIAMLHEKELVLNKDDTENMLRAVSILREISSVLTLRAERSSIDQIVSSYFKSANSIQTNQNQTIEQNIQIQAEFPDATNYLEIEAAFNNLINSASQYANRKDEIKTSNFVTAYALTPQK